MAEKLTDLGEFGLIERLTSGLGPGDGSVVVGVGDDCAVIDDGGDGLLLVTTDLMAQGIHFLSGTDPTRLGDKLLSVNLSDIAAMGGTPRHAVIAVAIPPALDVEYLDGVYEGLRRRADRHGVSLVGGDTTSSRSGLVLSLTLTGRGEPGRVLTRDGALPGDRVLVSGTLGDSGAGLILARSMAEGSDAPDLTADDIAFLRTRHERPEPRVELGRSLAATDGTHSAIDLSDGLASDLGHICRRSAVGAVVDVSRLPLSDALRRHAAATGDDPRGLALAAGEDYELCVTADPVAAPRLAAAAESFGLPLTDVGEIVEGRPSIHWTDGPDSPIAPPIPGWDHFR